MKKELKGKVMYNNRLSRIICHITDERGYISITAGIYPPHCKNAHAWGTLVEEISEAFPKLKPYLRLHCLKFGKTDMETALYLIDNNCANGESGLEYVKNAWGLTDKETATLNAFCNFAIHKTYSPLWKQYERDKMAVDMFAKEVERLGIIERNNKQMEEFKKFVETL
jgi:hypothetical protein